MQNNTSPTILNYNWLNNWALNYYAIHHKKVAKIYKSKYFPYGIEILNIHQNLMKLIQIMQS